MANFMELIKQSSMKHWCLSGPERLVKVVSPAGQDRLLDFTTAMGYVTQEKYLLGKTSVQIESALGLRPFELKNVCYVYTLARLPEAAEVEFKLSCAFPDGKVFDDSPQRGTAGQLQPSLVAAAMSARQDFMDGKHLSDDSYTPVTNYYPPGSPQVLQWKLTAPVPLGQRIAIVTKSLPLSKR